MLVLIIQYILRKCIYESFNYWGAGFIGSHISERLTNEGVEVHVIDNLSTGRLENIHFIPKEHFYLKDITDVTFVSELIKKNNLIISFT